jgi:quercetin dioxygenase-like cupin family protein
MTEEFTTYGTDDERNQFIVHYEDIPQEELAPGAWSHLVAGKEAVVSFLTIPAGTYFPLHQHAAEQIMIVLEGFIDQIIDGKLHRVNKGDVIVMPGNIPHGGYVRDQDCKIIDIFAPAREDLVARAGTARAKMDN